MNARFIALILTATGLVAGCGSGSTPKNEAPTPEPTMPAKPLKSDAPAAPAIDVATLALKIDPVCKMSLEEYPATAIAEHGGKTYGFCSDFCKKKFVEAPDKILARLADTPAAEEVKH